MDWPLQSDCPKYYGDPDANSDGLPDRKWEELNLTRITPPWRMVLAWAPDKVLRTITIHKKCAPSLSGVLQNVWTDCEQSQAIIEGAGLHLFGGSYNFRMTRHGSRLSMHAYAVAIDLNPESNPLSKAWQRGAGMMPMRAVERFEQEGWTWGGRWTGRPDCQHFQAARVG